MAQTPAELIHEALGELNLWLEIAEDQDALLSRNKTREEALQLANYFEGRYDAFCDVRCLINASANNEPK